MRCSALIIALAAIASAAPQIGGNGGGILPVTAPGTTVGQGQAACGNNAQLSCCNKADTSGNSANTASGLLAGLIPGLLSGAGGLGLFQGCSKLDISAAIGVEDILNSQCKNTAACCQSSPQTQTGTLNVGLPCIALGGLL